MNWTRWIKWAAAVAGFCLAMAVTSEARIRRSELVDPHKDYTQRGIQVYAGFGAQRYEIEDGDYHNLDQLDEAGSFFFGVGVGLDRGVSLYFEGTGSEHQTRYGDVTFGTGMFGIKYAPNSGYPHLWQPYGKFGLGGVFLWEDDSPYAVHRNHGDDYGYQGPALNLSLGVDRFIGRRTAVFTEVGLTTGKFDQQVIDGDEHDLADEIGVTSGRIQFGLRFRL